MNADVLRSMRLSSQSQWDARPRIHSCLTGLRGRYETVRSKFKALDSKSQGLLCIMFMGCLLLSLLPPIISFWGRVEGVPISLVRFDNTEISSNKIHRHDLYAKREAPCKLSDPCTIKLVADLDKSSRVELDRSVAYKSSILTGKIWEDHGVYSLEWQGAVTEIRSLYNEDGRGMELSELVLYNGQLLSFDDRTGIVFALLEHSDSRRGDAIAKYILVEGNGEDSPKGMKIEWATEKDGVLWVGSFGKEFTKGQQILNENNMWVVAIDSQGRVQRKDWRKIFGKLRHATGSEFPGYLIHEAITWSPFLRRWVILPRRHSTEPYDDVTEEKMGTNKIILCTEDFSEIIVRTLSPGTTVIPERGFSSFKFLPGTANRIILGLRSAEFAEFNNQTSFVTVFDVSGNVLLLDTEVPFKTKFEGLEFVLVV